MSIAVKCTAKDDGLVDSQEWLDSIVIPGEVIFESGRNLITGHGSYRSIDSTNEQETLMETDAPDESKNFSIISSIGGRVRTVNKLVYVEPPSARYFGNIGDLVVGRVIEVEQRRWLVDLNSYQLSVLQLVNVKLPGGELRRKSEDDEKAMRSFLKEGDLIVAEVHEIYKDGSLQLHMPGIRTGKLGEGICLTVSPSCIKKQRHHRIKLKVPKGFGCDTTQIEGYEEISIGAILGCNGMVWIGPPKAMELGNTDESVVQESKNNVDTFYDDLVAITRVRNCIISLASNGLPILDTTIQVACEESWIQENINEDLENYSAKPQEDKFSLLGRLLRKEYSMKLCKLVRNKLNE